MKSVRESSQVEAFQNATVFYPDFPEQVIEMDEVEQYIYQMEEYLGVAFFGISLRPEFEATERNRCSRTLNVT